MTTSCKTHRAWPLPFVAALGLSTFLGTTAPAQTPAATSAARAAQDLAKYDKNKNGKLDADELAAQQADETKAAAAAVPNNPNGSDEVVEIS